MSKRKSDQYVEWDDSDLQYEIENRPMKDSCDAVRRKIRAFIDSGEMRVGEFQKAINVTSKSYSDFMGQNGPLKGRGSNVYLNAYQFFRKRELRGIKLPKKVKTAAAAATNRVDISGIILEGEEQDKVEVYDTCDEVRRKINAHLQKPAVTAAQFLRDIAAQYHKTPKKIQSKQLNDFRSKKGPDSGNTSSVYYGAYVYFEKIRVREGKPKTKTREEMERIWGREGGMDLERANKSYLVRRGEEVTQDQYGRIRISGRGRFGW
ncbi:uncharacterized protein BDR25DRAFT_330958 [Lindgomyces ingoldianus]|uniref:Uncharacterized protein n=1 Tax=Lindgomyces ingoldianus TaxID=673940 RepID=A0ACB6REX4_9PLEO|nr:uncharacterized protein BDR25DRAFT_330958 [Lindgomyces ingoldianus]KAF2477042.1 hypothetical protein BDR25DRAFT_330958 [Lindgomyces ingoldianus]